MVFDLRWPFTLETECIKTHRRCSRSVLNTCKIFTQEAQYHWNKQQGVCLLKGDFYILNFFPSFLRFLFCFLMGKAQYFLSFFSVQDDSLGHPTVPCVRRVNKEIQIYHSERSYTSPA